METVTTNVGTRSAENVDISSVAGAGSPWTVTLSGAPSNTAIGDTLTDEAGTPDSFLITGISGSDLTVVDAYGVGSAPDDSATSQATTVRTFATPTAFEAELDNTDFFPASSDAVADMYDDSAFSDSQVLIDSGTGLTSVTLKAASGEEHGGVPGAGVRFTSTANDERIYRTAAVTVNILDIEVDVSGGDQNNQKGVIASNKAATNLIMKVARCIVHDIAGGGNVKGIGQYRGAMTIENCLVFDIISDETSTAWGISADDQYRNAVINNNTVYNIGCDNEGASADPYGIIFEDDPQHTVQNNLVGGVFTDGSGDAYDYSHTSPSNATVNTNASEDATAPDPITGNPIVPADEFNSIGGEEFWLKDTDAESYGAGTDLGADYGEDLSGFNRHTDDTYDPWDVGCFELQELATGTTYDESLTLATQATATWSETLILPAGLTLAASAGVTELANLVMGTSLSLATSAGVSEGQNLTIPETLSASILSGLTLAGIRVVSDSVTLAVQSGMSLTDALVAAAALSAAVEAGLAQDASLVLPDALSLAVTAGLSETLGTFYEQALSAGVTAGLTLDNEAILQALLTAAAQVGTTLDTTAILGTAMTLAAQVAASLAGSAQKDVSLTLAASQGLTQTSERIVDDALALAVTGDYALDTQADLAASITFAVQQSMDQATGSIQSVLLSLGVAQEIACSLGGTYEEALSLSVQLSLLRAMASATGPPTLIRAVLEGLTLPGASGETLTKSDLSSESLANSDLDDETLTN